ncbi:H-NS histone family protein [Cupriavidus sp. H18C2]|uniref:H-NS histone family protein n=1 Tax=Cupriavidus sp. H18C2 TaxID=3241602 RepID=UPI003BF8CE74
MPTAYPEISVAQTLRERADAVLWIKSQMARLGLTYEHLLTAGCFAPPGVAGDSASGVIRFRDASGHAWDGVGALPEWLQRAVNAGQSIEHFRVEREG